MLEGKDLENELAYKSGDSDIRESLLSKAMEKLKKSEEFTADAQEEFKKHTEVRQPPSKKPSMFEKVKEGLKKLFS